MQRDAALQTVRERERNANGKGPWDILVIGGGATGIGIALDAATRGMHVLLVEQSDFGKGTSSRSTKLVHGGVRYLRQGNISLVREALHERTLLLKNAPHLVHDLPFLIPCLSRWQVFFYGVGLKAYDFLSTRGSFGASRRVSAKTALEAIPTLRTDISQHRLRGGVIYHDGQFDDTRLLINMARTAEDYGACLINYLEVTELQKDAAGTVVGVQVLDHESGEAFEVEARCVINAAGPFCDAVRRLDDADEKPMIAPSQGVHIVLPRRFFPGDTAMIVPKTSDGRVLFIIPWHDHAVVGTTDTPIPDATLEPSPKDEELAFLLKTAGEYLAEAPTAKDILAVFTGIRPLVKGDASAKTASLSRDHTIRIADSGLITITGGKWTTVRRMAEDCVNHALEQMQLPKRECQTSTLPLHGCRAPTKEPVKNPRSFYGSDLDAIEELERESPSLAELLHPSLAIHKSEVVWATRHEMARCVEDVLARRTRALFLNATAAIESAPQVASLMAEELGKDDSWCAQQVAAFTAVAQHYLPPRG